MEDYDRYAGCWFGRSEADAPDIDSKVFFTLPKGHDRVKPGDMITVRITECPGLGSDWESVALEPPK